jgi:hypothetical protein
MRSREASPPPVVGHRVLVRVPSTVDLASEYRSARAMEPLAQSSQLPATYASRGPAPLLLSTWHVPQEKPSSYMSAAM